MHFCSHTGVHKDATGDASTAQLQVEDPASRPKYLLKLIAKQIGFGP